MNFACIAVLAGPLQMRSALVQGVASMQMKFTLVQDVASILCTGTIPSLGFHVTPFPKFVWSGGMVACLVLVMSTIYSFLFCTSTCCFTRKV